MKEYSRPKAELLKLGNDLLTASNEDPFNPPPIELCESCPSNQSHGDPNAEECLNTAVASVVNRAAF
ncbi:MAG: hypothetical protein IKY03_01070 [Clostridia bacterium]|nr:hypothetical protein [Clostridia bacterium]